MKELRVSSFSTAHEGIPAYYLFALQEGENIKEIHVTLDKGRRTPQTVRELAKYAFNADINAHDIRVNNYDPDEKDRMFAEEFGFEILPIVYLHRQERNVEAWIAPVLLPKSHPFCERVQKSAAVHVIPKNDNGKDDDFSYYVRLRVDDQPGVLNRVTEEFGNAGISIQQMRQPKAEEGNSEADMAFLLWPCEAENLQSALTAIAGLSSIVMKVNPPLRVFSKSK